MLNTQGSGRRAAKLSSAEVVFSKLQHFVAQTMGMGLMTVGKTRALGLRGAASAEPFANADTLVHTLCGHLHQVFEFRPEKWTRRNVNYMHGARKYTKGLLARGKGLISYRN